MIFFIWLGNFLANFFYVFLRLREKTAGNRLAFTLGKHRRETNFSLFYCQFLYFLLQVRLFSLTFFQSGSNFFGVLPTLCGKTSEDRLSLTLGKRERSTFCTNTFASLVDRFCSFCAVNEPIENVDRACWLSSGQERHYRMRCLRNTIHLSREIFFSHDLATVSNGSRASWLSLLCFLTSARNTANYNERIARNYQFLTIPQKTEMFFKFLKNIYIYFRETINYLNSRYFSFFLKIFFLYQFTYNRSCGI